MGSNERVILIKGDAGKWYNQAIFIMNKDVPEGQVPVDFVAEAEKIIKNYLQRKSKPLLKRSPQNKPSAVKNAKYAVKEKKTDFLINACMVLGCLMIAAALTFGLLS